MSGSAPEEPQTSIPQSTACVPDPAPVAVGPGGSSDVAFGEHNLSFTTTDVSLVEMMEIEYTQLQHILYSHTEAQASEVTLIRQPSELIGVPVHQQENKCPALGKNKTAPATPSLQFTYPLFTMNTCSTAGGANPPQTQTSGTSCTILEAAKHQDLGIPKTFSFCYQEIESTKQTVGAMNKALPEEVWIKVGDTLCKQAINRRSCSRINPSDTNVDRKPLSEIQNMCDDSQSSVSAQGTWPAAQPGASVQMQSVTQDGVAQRRERHNRMERDRRRRIRICCDELNLLVPFCTVDTDKATTLQWTTAFLKYIQERHGDSLKQEFETVFCGKTGRRLKTARSDSFVTCPVQENTHSYGDQVV
ncbi:transcription factor-like 5 protein isoform X4 [Columba livia]|uniref:transcription factor-like 5 protein isoform X4 n=1 Tax=Columba livia TaxID=8932 RepID=UPI0031BA4A42